MSPREQSIFGEPFQNKTRATESTGDIHGELERNGALKEKAPLTSPGALEITDDYVKRVLRNCLCLVLRFEFLSHYLLTT